MAVAVEVTIVSLVTIVSVSVCSTMAVLTSLLLLVELELAIVREDEDAERRNVELGPRMEPIRLDVRFLMGGVMPVSLYAFGLWARA